MVVLAVIVGPVFTLLEAVNGVTSGVTNLCVQLHAPALR